MALNKVFAYDERKVRVRTVPAGTKVGAGILVNGRPAFVIAANTGETQNTTLPDGTVVSAPVTGVGLDKNEASVAFDGSFETAVTGATTSTEQDVAVYITSAGALTLTSTDNTLFGYTDYPKGYVKVAGRAVVRIGD